eukprot:superscaffoldBa00004421_g18858
MSGTVAPGKQCVAVLKKRLFLIMEPPPISVVGAKRGQGDVECVITGLDPAPGDSGAEPDSSTTSESESDVPPANISTKRDSESEMEEDEKHLVLLGKISSHMTLSKDRVCSKRGQQKESITPVTLQPGPVYFLVPRKCGVFGVCCEGVPQQVNYLINEPHCIHKGSAAVISYLHHFFSQYGLGEKHLHCDNCSGQDKNKLTLWYLGWQCMVGLHDSVSLNFLTAGHTKFAPDWCFGLFKKRFHHTPVSSLENICRAMSSSTSESSVNIPQLIGDETGQVFVQTHDWHSFLTPSFKPLPGMKTYHHFRFTCTVPGMVFAKEFANMEEEPFLLLRDEGIFDPEALPTAQNHLALMRCVSGICMTVSESSALRTQKTWFVQNQLRLVHD